MKQFCECLIYKLFKQKKTALRPLKINRKKGKEMFKKLCYSLAFFLNYLYEILFTRICFNGEAGFKLPLCLINRMF